MAPGPKPPSRARTHDRDQVSADIIADKVTSDERQAKRPSIHGPSEGKSTPVIKPGFRIKDKYEIVEMVGSGGYGQIFKARTLDSSVGAGFGVDGFLQKPEFVAIKAVMKDAEAPRAVLEQRILRELTGKPNYPKLISSCPLTIEKKVQLNLLIMELLGSNMSELRRSRPNQRFNVNTAVRVGIQMNQALEALHNTGHVHRDVKPANMCIGLAGEKRRRVYIVDFGLARKFINNGKLIARHYAGFKGTLRYCSINAHRRKDQMPADDLVSMYWSICELADGALPWRSFTDQDLICKLKTETKRVSKRMPEKFMKVYEIAIDELMPQAPDYEEIDKILKSLLPPNFDENGTPYEWEIDDSGEKKKKDREKVGSPYKEKTASPKQRRKSSSKMSNKNLKLKSKLSVDLMPTERKRSGSTLLPPASEQVVQTDAASKDGLKTESHYADVIPVHTPPLAEAPKIELPPSKLTTSNSNIASCYFAAGPAAQGRRSLRIIDKKREDERRRKAADSNASTAATANINNAK